MAAVLFEKTGLPPFYIVVITIQIILRNIKKTFMLT